MDPRIFRRHLRKIVANTARASAIAGTAFVVGCSINIVQGPGEGGRLDGGGEVVVDSRPDLRPDQTQPPQSCPVNYTQQDCYDSSKIYKGTYHKILTASDPDPLTVEQCRTLCYQELVKLCPSSGDPNFDLGRQVMTCKETKEGNTRKMACDYQLQPACAVAGRRPAGLEDQLARTTPLTPLEEAGAFFAELAFLEDAAVTAFEYLVEELKAYSAPAPLIALATQAIGEEQEHVELMTALAQRYGATPQRATAAPFQLRPIAEIAIENAREGCVRESFGSLLGFWQSIASEDPAVRGIMDRIAYEESHHGALSWAIDEWLKPQLSGTDLDRYQQAHAQAIEEIQREIQNEPSEAMRRYAGFPTAAQAQDLFSQLIA